jgi:hypothetical protein
VYRLGNVTNEHLGVGAIAQRTFWQLYVHDNPADYDNIDTITQQLIQLFHESGPFPAYDILQTRYLETSRDLDDEIFKTIVRYVRFESMRLAPVFA